MTNVPAMKKSNTLKKILVAVVTKTLFFYLKMGVPRPLFHLFLSFQTHYKCYNKKMSKNVHPVLGAGIRTHNLWKMSLLPHRHIFNVEHLFTVSFIK